LSLPSLKFFYFDRIWLKAYPLFFSNLRIEENKELYMKYRKEKVFEVWTYRAFTLYRTLDCIRRAIVKVYELDKITTDLCRELRKYGEKDYFDFVFMDSQFDILIADNVYSFIVEQIKSLRFVSYTTVIRDKVHYEKAIYIEYEPWLRVMVKPYLEGFIPPMIRVFYNPLLRAKYELGIKTDDYIAEHDNFIDPYALDNNMFSRFIELNHRYAFDFDFLRNFINREWFKWFGSNIDLRVKVTQVEIAFDSRIPKMNIVSSFHFVGGRSKTIKYSVDSNEQFYSWTDSGLKYYITVKKGLQLKTYTKAWRDNGDFLNRIEFTVNVNLPIELVNANYVLERPDLLEVYRILNIAMLDNDSIERIKEILRPLVRCETRCEDHYAFWFDLITSGQIKGTTYYRDIARVYKQLGIIKVKGRGRNSVYVINEKYLDLVKTIRRQIEQYIGVFKELKLPTTKPQNQKTT